MIWLHSLPSINLRSFFFRSMSGVCRRSVSFSQSRSKAKNTARPRRYKSSLNWLTPLESTATISPSRMALCALNLSKALRKTSKLLYWLRRRETRRQWPFSTWASDRNPSRVGRKRDCLSWQRYARLELVVRPSDFSGGRRRSRKFSGLRRGERQIPEPFCCAAWATSATGRCDKPVGRNQRRETF